MMTGACCASSAPQYRALESGVGAGKSFDSGKQFRVHGMAASHREKMLIKST